MSTKQNPSDLSAEGAIQGRPEEWPYLSFETLCNLDILGVIRDEAGHALGLFCEDSETGKQYSVSMDNVREFQEALRVIEEFRQEL